MNAENVAGVDPGYIRMRRILEANDFYVSGELVEGSLTVTGATVYGDIRLSHITPRNVPSGYPTGSYVNGCEWPYKTYRWLLPAANLNLDGSLDLVNGDKPLIPDYQGRIMAVLDLSASDSQPADSPSE